MPDSSDKLAAIAVSVAGLAANITDMKATHERTAAGVENGNKQNTEILVRLNGIDHVLKDAQRYQDRCDKERGNHDDRIAQVERQLETIKQLPGKVEHIESSFTSLRGSWRATLIIFGSLGAVAGLMIAFVTMLTPFLKFHS